ncbi:hypothetical protein ACNGTO_01280 [Bisgaard Taxon 45]
MSLVAGMASSMSPLVVLSVSLLGSKHLNHLIHVLPMALASITVLLGTS